MHVSLMLPDGANIAMEESGNVVDDASIGKNFDDPLLLDVPQILFLALCNDLILMLGIQHFRIFYGPVNASCIISLSTRIVQSFDKMKTTPLIPKAAGKSVHKYS